MCINKATKGSLTVSSVITSTGVHQCTQAEVPTKGDVSFRPRPVAASQIISIFIHEINSWLSSQPKGITVFVRGCYSRLHPVNKNSSYTAAKSYFVSLSDVTLFSPLSTNTISQSGSITVFLTDPCSYLFRSLLLAVIPSFFLF